MFDLFPRRAPSLPQDDPPREQKQRAEQLASAQLTYRWTDDVASLPGVPLAAKVPFPDLPTLPWLLDVTEVVLQILENVIAVKRADSGKTAATEDAAARAAELRSHLSDLRTSFEESLQKGPIDDIRMAATRAVSQHGTGLLEAIEELRARIAALQDAPSAPMRQEAGLEAYRTLFDTIALPPIADTFMTDESFSYMRVAGPNPTLIRGITALPDNFPLTDAQYQAVMPGDSLAAALDARRLYLLDYVELDSLVAQPSAPKCVYAPIALFAVEEASRRLVPVAIQCGQDAGSHPMFLRAEQSDAAAYWGWQMAKTVVQVAEGNYHELFVHLARTHLVIEAFCVATHRNLALSHPVNVLLLPHFEGTLFINDQAAAHLIAPGGPIDHIFGATLSATQQAASDDRLAFDFYRRFLPIDLSARMVDDPQHLPDYPYRDDGLLIWQAIKDWVGSYLAVYYPDDDAVRGDTELAAWVADIAGQGKIKGFVPITSRAQLRDVLTMVIFTASAQHAAVNFPQKPDMTFAPAITGAGWAPAPATETGQTESAWLALLPPRDAALQQLNALYALGSVYYRVLGEYRTNHFPYREWFEDPKITRRDGPLAQFQGALSQIEQTIRTRNQERAIPYEFLLPSHIPPSINI